MNPILKTPFLPVRKYAITQVAHHTFMSNAHSIDREHQEVDIIIPCYNEASSAAHLIRDIEKAISSDLLLDGPVFSIIIVDDGSNDNTHGAFQSALRENELFKRKTILRLSRNFGKEAAVYAGLIYCRSDACILIDADLQDPPDLITRIVSAWQDGAMIVNAVRKERESDGITKRLTAQLFYPFFRHLSGLDIRYNASDFRLLDRAVIDAILECSERVRFSKGLFAWAGFEQTDIFFRRTKRSFGKSKWSTWRLWNYALDGIFSFSTAPLRIWGYIGLIAMLGSFLQGTYVVVKTIVFGADVPGYASLFAAIIFLGGLQMTGIGIIGEYVGRIYVESKRRPHYVLRNIISL